MPSKEVPSRNPETGKPKEVINPIEKLFIASRGEIAVRAMKTCQNRGIPVVVSFTKQDKNSLPVRMTRKLRQSGWETAKIHSYYDQYHIIGKALKTGCDAIFLGYGFLSENPEFVKKCEDAGLKVLAPPSEVMEKSIKNKIKAKETAKKLGIPVLEGSENLSTLEDAQKKSLELKLPRAYARGIFNSASSELKSAEAENVSASHDLTIGEFREGGLKFPVMLKIPDMGGGKGNLVARNLEELKSAYDKLKRRKPNCEILMEHFVENAVHVEVQIAADKYGKVISLGERDCTMQRNHQKVIEESPSPHITNRMREGVQNAAINFAKEIGYQGIGTWEFIIDKDKKGADGNPAWYFMEVNPRIQVEHGVTEEQTGVVDIVKLMIEIAEGKRLSISQNEIESKIREGHTIEARLCAEKLSVNNKGENIISPCPGKISKIYFPPEDENVRVDTGVENGDEMSSDFDSLIAKIIIHGKNRKEARTKLIDYLKQITVEGISCNKEFLIDILESEEFRNSNATTTFIERFLKRGKEKLDKAKKGLKEKLKKTRRKLRRKATIFRRNRRKKHNGKKH